MASGSSQVIVVLVLIAAIVTTVGVVSCIVAHYHWLAPVSNRQRAQCSPTQDQLIDSSNNHRAYITALPSINPAPPPEHSSHMLSLEATFERERLAQRDREVRIRSMQRDMLLNLPHPVYRASGEDAQSQYSKWRFADQHAETKCNCVKAPPNKTVQHSDVPASDLLPFRSKSTGLLSNFMNSTKTSSNDWSQNVVRCHSMSSRYNANVGAVPNMPSVIIPVRISHERRSLRKMGRTTCEKKSEQSSSDRGDRRTVSGISCDSDTCTSSTDSSDSSRSGFSDATTASIASTGHV